MKTKNYKIPLFLIYQIYTYLAVNKIKNMYVFIFLIKPLQKHGYWYSQVLNSYVYILYLISLVEV